MTPWNDTEFKLGQRSSNRNGCRIVTEILDFLKILTSLAHTESFDLAVMKKCFGIFIHKRFIDSHFYEFIEYM